MAVTWCSPCGAMSLIVAPLCRRESSGSGRYPSCCRRNHFVRRTVACDGVHPSAADIAGMIDHAILKPELTRAEVDAQLETAARYRIFSVCVRPSDVAYAVARLEGTGVAVGTVIGFPHGTTSTGAKRAESEQAI